MSKKIKNMILSIICPFLILVIVLSSLNTRFVFSNAELSHYHLVFNSAKNKFHSYTGNKAYDGEANVKTNLGNDISFSYYQVKGLTSTWHILGKNGYFYNNTPLNGLENISISFKTEGAQFDILYSRDTSFSRSESLVSSSTNIISFDFDNTFPNYVKILNKSDGNLNIESIDFSFACVSNLNELNVLSEDEDKGSVEGGGYKPAGENVTISAIPAKGYSFIGWYSGENLVSDNNPYTFVMPDEQTTYVAKFSIMSFEVNLFNCNDDLGSITGSGTFLFKSSVDIHAVPHEGVAFDGWYDENNQLLSSLVDYTFEMPSSDLNIYAKFSYIFYSVTLVNCDESMGEIYGEGSYSFEQQITLNAIPKNGFSFFGWFIDDELVSRDENYTFSMPSHSLVCYGRFTQNYRLNISSEDESMGIVSAPTEFGAGLDVTINAIPGDGFVFDYWYDEDLNVVSFASEYTFEMPSNDLTLYASFAIGYSLALTSSDDTKGIVFGGGLYGEGKIVEARVELLENNLLLGWYNNQGELISKSNPYVFEMPAFNFSLTAYFKDLSSTYANFGPKEFEENAYDWKVNGFVGLKVGSGNPNYQTQRGGIGALTIGSEVDTLILHIASLWRFPDDIYQAECKAQTVNSENVLFDYVFDFLYAENNGAYYETTTTESDDKYEFSFDFSNVDEEVILTFSSMTSKNRFVIWNPIVS